MPKRPSEKTSKDNFHGLFKGKIVWDGFLLIANIKLGEDLTHLAYKEKTQCDIFLWNRRKFLLHFVLLGLRYDIPSPMVEILTLWSPHKLLKNLGALSEYAKCSQSSTKIKKIEIRTLYPGYDGMIKKPAHVSL
jgi:hypothetical protein